MTQAHENLAVSNEFHPHILVMEDDLNVAKGLEMVLTQEGYDVYLAGTGKLAMEAFKNKQFDLLVADIRLPDINGMEIIKEVKETKPETEVIAITGYATTSLSVEAMKLGIHDFLPKPFTEDEISQDDPTTGLRESVSAMTDELSNSTRILPSSLYPALGYIRLGRSYLKHDGTSYSPGPLTRQISLLFGSLTGRLV